MVFAAPSLDLKAASVPLIAQNVCKQKEFYGDSIMDTMFCAGYLDKSSSVDACEGDSGGPLVCADENGENSQFHWINSFWMNAHRILFSISGVHSLYGIISWGQRCGDSSK